MPADMTLEQHLEQTLKEQMRMGMEKGVDMKALLDRIMGISDVRNPRRTESGS